MTAPRPLQSDQADASVWLDAPSLDGLRTAAIGAFACADAKAGARLLDDGCEQLREEGYGAVLGPMDGDTWAGHRLVTETDGRPPFFLEPRNLPHHVDAFTQAGFQTVARYASAASNLPIKDGKVARPRSEDVAVASGTPPALTLRPFDPADAEAELRRLHALSLQAFAGNAFYRPITADRFVASYTAVVPHLDPDLVLLAEDEAGGLKGFLFALPDLEQGGRPTAVILKTYASLAKGAGSLLAARFHRLAHAKGYVEVIHALMHETNLSSRHSDNTGARVFRRYALYGRRL